MSKPGKSILDLSEKRRVFWLHSSVFALEKQRQNLHFQSFLPLKHSLVATFNETCAPTSRKHVVEQGIIMSNLSDKFRRSHPTVFVLEKQLKNLNFQNFFNLLNTLWWLSSRKGVHSLSEDTYLN